MALNTAKTYLKYGTKQVETATVVGTITTAGNATFTVTGSGITGSPLAVSVAVLLGDTARDVAAKAAAALNSNAAVSALYLAIAYETTVILKRKIPAANDATLNVAIANGTCAGLTAAPTSANTTAGVALASLSPIVNYPDTGSAPSKLDTTDLSQPKYKTHIFGLQEAGDLTFEANYDETIMLAINALTGTYAFQLQFGSLDGAFTWEGQVSCFANGAGVDEVRKMTITCSASTPIEFRAT